MIYLFFFTIILYFVLASPTIPINNGVCDFDIKKQA